MTGCTGWRAILVIGLLAFRLIWGFCRHTLCAISRFRRLGSRRARWSIFHRGITGRYIELNPAGTADAGGAAAHARGLRNHRCDVGDRHLLRRLVGEDTHAYASDAVIILVALHVSASWWWACFSARTWCARCSPAASASSQSLIFAHTPRRLCKDDPCSATADRRWCASWRGPSRSPRSGSRRGSSNRALPASPASRRGHRATSSPAH